MKYVIKRGDIKPMGDVILESHTKKGVTRITPDRSQKVWNHSPDGFEFGYGGSGPAQLALAILLDFTNDNTVSVSLHQDFKWDFISVISRKEEVIDGDKIKEWIKKKSGSDDRPSDPGIR